MIARVSERRIADVLVCYLRSHYPLAREYRLYEKNIDVLALDIRTADIIAFEVKVRDWTRAAQQAMLNLTVANRSYIAVWADAARCVSIDVLRNSGLGLIAVGSRWGEVTYIRDAPTSPFLNRITNERARGHLLRSGTQA